jgi:hypothetical protein
MKDNLSDEEFEALLKEKFKSYEKEYDVVKEVLGRFAYAVQDMQLQNVEEENTND